MTMLGASIKDGVLAFNQFTGKLGKGDAIGVALGVGLIYLNKGIMYGATALGSAVCPGVGTVVGFIVGGVICIVIDVLASNWLDDLIDKIAK